MLAQAVSEGDKAFLKVFSPVAIGLAMLLLVAIVHEHFYVAPANKYVEGLSERFTKILTSDLPVDERTDTIRGLLDATPRHWLVGDSHVEAAIGCLVAELLRGAGDAAQVKQLLAQHKKAIVDAMPDGWSHEWVFGGAIVHFIEVLLREEQKAAEVDDVLAKADERILAAMDETGCHNAAVSRIVKLGRSGSEPLLIRVMDHLTSGGNMAEAEKVAESLLNSGNPVLTEAAERWASRYERVIRHVRGKPQRWGG